MIARSCFLCLLLLLPFSYAKHKVAIIGGGIGGATCAYFLSQFAPGTIVDVYEKEDIVGGRLKHVTFGGEVCEVGGDAWSSVNTYMMYIMKQLSVPISNNSYDGNGDIGFYEGDGQWFKVNSNRISEARLLAQVELFKYHLSQNYNQRDAHDTPFSTIEDFVDAGGINAYTSVEMGEFLDYHEIDNNLAYGEVLPVIRGIYDQNLSVSAFAGIVSLLPALTDAYSVLGGNSVIVAMLLKAAAASVYPMLQSSHT